MKPSLELYVSAGYQTGVWQEQVTAGAQVYRTKASNIPLMIGFRYFFMDPQAGLYAGVEMGMNRMTATTEWRTSPTFFDSTAETATRFGINAGAGYVISRKLPISVGAQVNALNAFHFAEEARTGVTAQIGYEARF